MSESPEAYFDSLPEPRRTHMLALDSLIRDVAPGFQRHMRNGMVGYGVYEYAYASGRKGEWFRLGLASNKANIAVYVCAGDDSGYVAERFRDRLPKADIGKSCIRFKRFEDIDVDVLREVLSAGAASGVKL